MSSTQHHTDGPTAGDAIPVLTRDEVIARFDQEIQPCSVTLGDGRVSDYDAQTGKLSIVFLNTEAHCHSGTVVQGGFVAGMLDSAMSMAAIAYTGFQRAPASLEIKVSYLKATTPGNNRAVGWVMQAGKTVAFVEGELYNEQGDLLAKASSVARMVPRPG